MNEGASSIHRDIDSSGSPSHWSLNYNTDSNPSIMDGWNAFESPTFLKPITLITPSSDSKLHQFWTVCWLPLVLNERSRWVDTRLVVRSPHRESAQISQRASSREYHLRDHCVGLPRSCSHGTVRCRWCQGDVAGVRGPSCSNRGRYYDSANRSAWSVNTRKKSATTPEWPFIQYLPIRVQMNKHAIHFPCFCEIHHHGFVQKEY